MVEMIVVIGVLTLLIGIVVVAMGRISRTAKQNQAGSVMESLNAMVQNYSAVDENLAVLNGYYGDLGATLGAMPAPNPPDGKHAINVPAGNNGTTFPAIGTNNQSAAWRTWLVMQQLYAIPANKALFDKIPPEQRFYLTNSATNARLDPAGCFLVADGFGEPILFVPANGLCQVTIGTNTAANNKSLQSDGRVHTRAGLAWTPLNANPRPFWVSAGPDHFYAKGDDNVNSFDK
jgi:type II secretory pathway pseudopilin PulG